MEQPKKKNKKRLRKFIFWTIVVLIILFLIFLFFNPNQSHGPDSFFIWLCELIARIYNFLVDVYNFFQDLFSGMLGQTDKDIESTRSAGRHTHSYYTDDQSVGRTGNDVKSSIVSFLIFLGIFGLVFLILKSLWIRSRKYMYPIMVVDVILYTIHGWLCDLETWVGKDYFYNFGDYFYIIASEIIINSLFIQILIVSRKMGKNKPLTKRNIGFMFLWTGLGWAMSAYQDHFVDYQSMLKESVFFNNILYLAVVIVATFSAFPAICLWDFLVIRQKNLDKYLAKKKR
ncbi:MAG TPA: hypothetical protein PLK76_01920 [bacterium]|nr:hypothetical protein [bacterium]